MPRFDNGSHDMLIQAGYVYDEVKDKYFSRDSPKWDSSDQIASGIRQGAWPSRTIEEFREQEKRWIETQWSSILAMQAK
jgi:hypothetical protein